MSMKLNFTHFVEMLETKSETKNGEIGWCNEYDRRRIEG